MIVDRLPIEGSTLIGPAPPGLAELHATIAAVARAHAAVAPAHAEIARERGLTPFPPRLAALDEQVHRLAMIEIQVAAIDAVFS